MSAHHNTGTRRRLDGDNHNSGNNNNGSNNNGNGGNSGNGTRGKKAVKGKSLGSRKAVVAKPKKATAAPLTAAQRLRKNIVSSLKRQKVGSTSSTAAARGHGLVQQATEADRSTAGTRPDTRVPSMTALLRPRLFVGMSSASGGTALRLAMTLARDTIEADRQCPWRTQLGEALQTKIAEVVASHLANRLPADYVALEAAVSAPHHLAAEVRALVDASEAQGSPRVEEHELVNYGNLKYIT